MGSSEASAPHNNEEGDVIINWHLQYCASITLTGGTSIQQTADLIKAELGKIKSDYDFIKKLPGQHKNLLRLKATDRELRSVLDDLKESMDKLRVIASKTSQRIL